jgi:hypothetical protein
MLPELWITRQPGKMRIPALIVGALGFAYVLGEWILEGGLSGLTLRVLGLAIGAIALVVVSRWRLGIYLFLAWLVFEDLPRKYLGNNMLIYFGKDFLVAVVYLAFLVALIRREVRTFRAPFLVPLLLFFWLGLVQVFNPNSSSIFYGLLGVKLDFYYIPLMFLGYSLIRSEPDLKGFLNYNLALGVLVSLVGIIQSVVGLNFLNPHNLAPELETLGRLTRESPLTHRLVRNPPSVFVSAGRFDFYLIFVFILALGAAGYQLLRPTRQGRLVYAALGLIAVAALLSGSRGAVIYPAASAVILALGLVWGSRYEQEGRTRLVKAVRRSLLAVGVCIVAIVILFPETVAASWSFYYETLNPESPTSELHYRIADYPVQNLMQVFEYRDWPMGYGIGTCSLGVQYVTHVLGRPAPPVIAIENGYGTLILELGILGPFLWLLWTGTFIVSGWRVVRRLLGTALFPVGISILWFAFLLLFPFTYGGLAAYQNYLLNAYLWLFVGILFRIPRLAEESRRPAGLRPCLPNKGPVPRIVGGHSN